MKILHTSDWHLGHILFGYDRTKEQQLMLDQMVAIVSQEQPDAMLICGDVYHTTQPSTAVQTMFNTTIVRLHIACPQMTIIVTAGNHDSSSKHEIFRTPWQYLNVHTIGSLNKENLSEHIIVIPHIGIIIALPYTHEKNLHNGLFEQLLKQAETINIDNLPIILTAHTSIVGADYSGHDNSTEKNIGGIDTIDLKTIGKGYDYFALGHIHHPQFIHSGQHNIRYSGSPLPISFDENYQHSVSIVELIHHGDKPSVRIIEIDNPHPLTTLPTTGFASWEEVKQLIKDFPADLENYIRLNVDITTHPVPSDVQNEIMFLTEGKKCRFCLINVHHDSTTNVQTKLQLTIQEIRTMQPIDIVKMYADDTDNNFDEDMQYLFEQTLQIINKEQREV